MFDDFSKRSKAIKAALALAEKKGWRDTTLADIAQEAGLSLSDLRAEFSCKSDILGAFQAKVDEEVLGKVKAAPEGQSPRDRLFDVVMTRFDVLAPYKGALKRISAYLASRPGEAASLACSTLTSQYWMLAGAGAKLDGAGAAVRVAGLTAIYAKVFEIWLHDTSPSLDKTMAALDKRLARGERMLNRAETACSDFCRFACGFLPRGWKRGEHAEAPPPRPAPQAPSASAPA
jgi:AcrR family transcriptional regulator